MRITVLGSGTSHGIPMIGCRCPVCTSDDPRNRRTRTSAAIRLGHRTVLVDASPELRLQAVAAGIDALDAVLFTHAHADHIMGFDDLRRFAEISGRAVPVYATPATLARVRTAFHYAVTDDAYASFGIPVVHWRPVDGPFDLCDHRVTPVTLQHGVYPATGYRFDSPDGRSLAWCPDCGGIPPDSLDLLQGLDALFLDGLRHEPHPTHFTVRQAVDAVRRLAPRRAWLIHMTHDLDHAATEAALPDGVALAYDGMTLDL